MDSVYKLVIYSVVAYVITQELISLTFFNMCDYHNEILKTESSVGIGIFSSFWKGGGEQMGSRGRGIIISGMYGIRFASMFSYS